MLDLQKTIPNSKIFTKAELQKLLHLTDRQTWDKIYYLKKSGIIDSVKRGIFVNKLIDKFGEEEKVRIATTLFPSGYVTGYEALRYWEETSETYEGICLRVDWAVYVAVPRLLSKKIEWSGYIFKPVQITNKLNFGIQETPNGKVAEPEKAVLDLLYIGFDPDNIEFDMLDRIKLKKYAQKFPPKVRNQICH